MAVERNREIIRQWKILKQVASARDCTVARLTSDHGVSTRTIYRDLAALEGAGFPLYTEEVEGTKYWRLSGWPFRHLQDTAFTFPELCAFYIHRGRLAGIAGLPLEDDLTSAMNKVVASLGPRMRGYLDKLAEVFCWKPDAPIGEGARAVNAEVLVKATVDHRKLQMDYYSLSNRRTKQYKVEPYRLTAGNGALYLYAYVAEYGQMRTFAVQRIKKLRILEEQFDPVREVGEPHVNSIGIGSGTPELVEVAFGQELAPYIEERCWHESQQITRQPDGSIVLSLRVSLDQPLRSWILSFGHRARVLAPSRLAAAIMEELEESREQYAPRMPFELPPLYDARLEPSLPFQAPRSGVATKPAVAPRAGHRSATGAGTRAGPRRL